MYQLKVMLNDIVDRAFPDDPKLKSYKAFYIEVLDKDYKGRHGDYNLATRHIRLMNTYRDEKKLVVTSIHELAHHVNHMQGNTDIHGKGFYANYQKLLYAALDMNLFNKDEYIAMVQEHKDSQSEYKVVKMVQNYESKDVGYKKEIIKFTVFGGYDIKDTLKNQGYKFNKIGKAWEKEIREIDKEKEEEWLRQFDVKYKVTDANQYIVKSEDQRKAKRVVFYVYNSYEIRDKLRELGCHYKSDIKAWVIETDKTKEKQERIAEIQKALREMNIPRVMYKRDIGKKLCYMVTW